MSEERFLSPASIHVLSAFTAGWYARHLLSKHAQLTEAQLRAAKSSLDWSESFEKWAWISFFCFALFLLPAFVVRHWFAAWIIVVLLWILTSQVIYLGFAVRAALRIGCDGEPYPRFRSWLNRESRARGGDEGKR
jgi:hypothetical protein